MGYEIKLTDDAVGTLDTLPTWLLEPVRDHLRRLAESPRAVSRTVVSPPDPPIGGMMSEFEREARSMARSIALCSSFDTARTRRA